jgi:hypothetical protein
MFRVPMFHYTPSKESMENTFTGMQIESLGMLSKRASKGVFDVSELENLLEEVINLQKYFSKRTKCKKHYGEITEIKQRLLSIYQETTKFVTQHYPKKQVIPAHRKAAPALIVQAFLTGLDNKIFIYNIFTFLLLDELEAVSKVNKLWNTTIDKVPFATPYAYVKKGKVIVQLNHLPAAPLYGDFKSSMSQAFAEQRYCFWKSDIEKIGSVPMELLRAGQQRQLLLEAEEANKSKSKRLTPS